MAMATEHFQDDAPELLEVLCGMSRKADAQADTRLAAIRDWLDRAGYRTTQKHEVSSDLRSLSDEELHERLLAS